MFKQKFYHGTMRKYIALFGALFDDVLIDRQDANGNVIISGDLTVNGNTTFASTNPYHAGGTIDINGNILLQKGKNNFTCASAGTLAWTITYPTHTNGANAVVLVTSGHYHTLIRSQTSKIGRAHV